MQNPNGQPEKNLLLVTVGILVVSGPIVLGLVNAPPTRAQSAVMPARLTFDVASIKQNLGPNFPGRVDDNGNLNVLPGGRLTTERASLFYIIESAYQLPLSNDFPLRALKPWEISGEPGWIHSTYYDIQAKAENPNVSVQQMRLMLRSLLEDRFNLKIHRESKDLPVFTLTAAKSGLKLPAPKDGSCVTPSPDANIPPPPARSRIYACGRVAGYGFPDAESEISGGKVSMASFSSILTNLLGRTVVDNTGFTGIFDLHLVYAGFLPGQYTETTTSSSTLPTIFTAMEEQLGLKLESAKRPVEILVIEHVEKLTENEATDLSEMPSCRILRLPTMPKTASVSKPHNSPDIPVMQPNKPVKWLADRCDS